jgi:hypothetical protein
MPALTASNARETVLVPRVGKYRRPRVPRRPYAATPSICFSVCSHAMHWNVCLSSQLICGCGSTARITIVAPHAEHAIDTSSASRSLSPPGMASIPSRMAPRQQYQDLPCQALQRLGGGGAGLDRFFLDTSLCTARADSRNAVLDRLFQRSCIEIVVRAPQHIGEIAFAAP